MAGDKGKWPVYTDVEVYVHWLRIGGHKVPWYTIQDFRCVKPLSTHIKVYQAKQVNPLIVYKSTSSNLYLETICMLKTVNKCNERGRVCGGGGGGVVAQDGGNGSFPYWVWINMPV